MNHMSVHNPEYVHLALHTDGVAVITLDKRPANALNVPLLNQFLDAVGEAQSMPDAQAIVITGANGIFCAGMDLIEVFDALRRHNRTRTSGGGFDSMASDRDRVVLCFNDLLETGPKPTVAAVEKAALGGGFEICLACNALVTTPDAVLGLPELRVGILPDFGGVQRLIRLLPMRKALNMMLFSKTVRGKDTFINGEELVDSVVAEPSKLITVAKEIALEMASGVRPRRQALSIARDVNWRGEAESAVQESRLKKMYPWNSSKIAAEMLLNCVDIGILQGPTAGQEYSKHANSVLSKQRSHKSAVRAFGAHHRARHAAGLQHIFLSFWAWLLGIVAVVAAAGTHLTC